MSDRRLLLIGASALVLICAIEAFAASLPRVLAVVALMLLIAVPGALILGILRVELRFAGSWIMYSASITVALLVFTGMLLNLVPAGLTSRGWSITVASEVAVLVFGYEVRERRGTTVPTFRARSLVRSARGYLWPEAEQVKDGEDSETVARSPWRGRMLHSAGLIMCIGFLAAAVLLSNASTGVGNASFTTLSSQRVGTQGTEIVVRSSEKSVMTYVLEVGAPTVSTRKFTLLPGQSYVVPLHGAGETLKKTVPLNVRLYRAGQPGQYRWLRLYAGSTQAD